MQQEATSYDLLLKQNTQSCLIEQVHNRERVPSSRFHIKMFHSYLIGSRIIVYTDHATLKHLLTKKDTNQGYLMDPLFNNLILRFEKRKILIIKQQSYVSPTQCSTIVHPINESFFTEQLLALLCESQLVDIAIYFAIKEIPSYWSKDDCYWFLSLIKYCPNQIMRQCILVIEIQSISSFYHDHTCGGCFGPRKQPKRC